MSKENKKIAVYCRVARRDDDAIKSQTRTLVLFAVDKGYSEIRIYQDNGEGGHFLDRPALNQLNADILDGQIQAVAVTDLSRISRMQRLLYEWLCMALAQNIEIVPIHGDVDGTMYLRNLIYQFFNKR